MARWTPDPTFYPSAQRGDGGAAASSSAYVVTLNTGADGQRRPDALCTLDVDPRSSTYGQVVGRTDMPNVGDELHHFGWNACSSALCPTAPHPHVERRYLLVPGPALLAHPRPRHQARPAPAAARQGRSSRRSWRARPATAARTPVHCGPDGIYMNALGAPNGDGPGGIFVLDHDDFSVRGAWEKDRGPQYLAYDFWWHLGHDTMITSEWGTPEHGRGRPEPGAAAGRQVRPPAPRLGPAHAHARPGARPRRRAADGARAAPVARPEQDLRLRRRRRLAQGPLGLDLAVVPRAAASGRSAR